MKYLLFTTPTGGWFPTLYTNKTHEVNELKLKLAQIINALKGEEDTGGFRERCEEFLKTLSSEEMMKTESVHRPGVYQWHEAFNKDGDMGQVKHSFNLAPEDLEDYDIVHINLCGADVELVGKVKEALRASSTTVIVNLDYALEAHQASFASPASLYKAFMAADFVFAVEPAQAAYINYLLRYAASPARNKVSVPVIPHPVDVRGLRNAFVPHDRRMDKVVCCYHRYDGHIYIPSVVTWDLKAEKMVEEADGQMHTTPIKVPRYMAGVGQMSVPIDLFDGWIAYSPWEFYLYELSHATIGFDYYSIHSHDRFVEECAVLELPCVGNTNSYSVSQLNPYTCHGPLDFGGMRKSLLRLIEDEMFYMNCAEMAYQNVQALDHRPSKTVLLTEMNKWLVAEGKLR